MIKYVRYKEVSLYRGSFPSILLLLGLGISFVISRTSLYGCSLNRRSTVPAQNCGRFARRRSLGLKSNRSWQTTPYNMVNLLLRDVILVNLGFHMCRTRAVTVFPCLFLFFSLKERQIPIGWIDLAWANCYRANRPSGESTFGRNDLIPMFTLYPRKRRYFSPVWSTVHTYSLKTVTENPSFQKRSPEWRLLKMPFCCTRFKIATWGRGFFWKRRKKYSFSNKSGCV